MVGDKGLEPLRLSATASKTVTATNYASLPNGGEEWTRTIKPQREQIYSLPTLPLVNLSKMTGKRLSERPVASRRRDSFISSDTGNSKAEKTPENNVNTVLVRTTSKRFIVQTFRTFRP